MTTALRLERADFPPDWEDRPCEGTSIELWYGPDDDGERAYEEPADQLAWRERRAKELCADCPVRAFCLQSELARPIKAQWGVRGGMTAKERKTVIRHQHNVERRAS